MSKELPEGTYNIEHVLNSAVRNHHLLFELEDTRCPFIDYVLPEKGKNTRHPLLKEGRLSLPELAHPVPLEIRLEQPHIARLPIYKQATYKEGWRQIRIKSPADKLSKARISSERIDLWEDQKTIYTLHNEYRTAFENLSVTIYNPEKGITVDLEANKSALDENYLLFIEKDLTSDLLFVDIKDQKRIREIGITFHYRIPLLA